MEREQFKAILENYVAPMYTGAKVQDGGSPPASRRQRRLAFLLNGSEMVVRPSKGATYQYILRRSQYFEQQDADFVENFLKRLVALKTIFTTQFFNDILNLVIRRTVSERLNPIAPDLTSEILKQFETWAEQTYEGRRIAAAVGVDTTVNGGSGVPLLEVYGESYGVVLANGFDSFLTVAKNGQIIGYEGLAQVPSGEKTFAPLRFLRLAEWTENGKTGIGLNRNGEILLFKNKELAFAKRRGSWHHFTHAAVIQRASLNASFTKELCAGVYQTCLDVSFARTGGCIALVKRSTQNALLADKIVNDRDRIGEGSLKSRCLKTFTGKPFHQLDRRLRQDIVAMDGATILDYMGKLMAAGAIVSVPSGSDGGGRLAATKRLAQYGLAVKISGDGGIRGFADHATGIKELFSVA